MALALGDGASRWAGPEWARCLVDLWEETKKQSGLKIFYYIRRVLFWLCGQFHTTSCSHDLD